MSQEQLSVTDTPPAKKQCQSLPTGPNRQFSTKAQYFRNFMRLQPNGEIVIQNIEYTTWTSPDDSKTYPQLFDSSATPRRPLHILFPFAMVSSSNMYCSPKTGQYGTYGDVEYFRKTENPKDPFDINNATQGFSLCDRSWQHEEETKEEEMSLCCDFLEALATFLFDKNLEHEELWSKRKTEELKEAYKKKKLAPDATSDEKLEYLADVLSTSFKSPLQMVEHPTGGTIRYVRFSKSVFDNFTNYKKKPPPSRVIQQSPYLTKFYKEQNLFFNDIPLLEAKTMLPITNIKNRKVQNGDVVTVEAKVKAYDVAGKTGFKLEPQFLIKFRSGQTQITMEQRIDTFKFEPMEEAEALLDPVQEDETEQGGLFDENVVTSTAVVHVS